jgi:hypothetical protein
VGRCKAEKLATATTVAEADELLAGTGCAVPGGAAANIRKEAAAAIVWMRAHRADTVDQFDALPEASKEVLRGLYKVLPDAPGMHWSKKIFRLLQAFATADSPVKAGQARPEHDLPAAVGELGLGDEQSRPPDGEEEGVIGEVRERDAEARLAAQRQREDDQLLAAGIGSYVATAAKRQKDRSVLSPASLKYAAAARGAGAGGAGGMRVNVRWLPRKVLEDNLPEGVLRMLWVAGKWKADAVAKALKQEEKEAMQANARFESVAPMWGHRFLFFLGDHPRDTPDLNVVGKNLALATRMCLAGKESPLEKMVTSNLREGWEVSQDLLASDHQVPESALQPTFECLVSLFEMRVDILAPLLVNCGPAGDEVLRSIVRQAKDVKGMWPFLARGLSEGHITSTSRSTANAVWMTVLGPAMDQRTGSAPNGDTALAAAQARLSARIVADAGTDSVRRRLAPSWAQPARAAALAPLAAVALAQEAPAQMAGGWAPVPAWGPPPPAYMHAPPLWAQMPPQQPAAIGPPPSMLRILPPPSSAPPPLQAQAVVVKPGARVKADGWTGQPASTAMLGDRGVMAAEDAPSKHHCVMCARANPAGRVHLAWECAIKLARRAGGEPCPGFDALGNRVPSAWTAEGNLQPATVQAWAPYIERWGLEVAVSAPGPARLS